MRISDWSSEVCSSDLGFGAEVRYRSPKGLHLFTRPLGAVHKPVSRDIAVGLEVERALQGVFPLLWKGRSHRREHPVHEDLAHEDQLLIRNADDQIRRGVGPAEKQYIHDAIAQIDRLDLADRAQIGRAHVLTPVTNA